MLIALACQTPQVEEQELVTRDESTPYKPETELKTLFHDVQMAHVFADSKTFVDSDGKQDPNTILSAYQQSKDAADFELGNFVEQNFNVPSAMALVEVEEGLSMQNHLHKLWPKLTRKADSKREFSTLLGLPHDYVVPGGRFREIYYWDSFFTMLGLLESEQDQLMHNMLRNFSYLIEEYGFIPNGNRSYYLGRSQPPFFSSMVMLWAQTHGMDEALAFLPAMIKEHNFWMEGAETLTDENNQNKRVVLMPDGTVLNRFWDNYAAPRPESYREDFELAQAFPEALHQQIYRDLRAGAESGWDYSSRWFSDGASLDSIMTTKILPVDLNCLMHFMESSIATLSAHHNDSSTASRYEKLAQARAKAINHYFWDDVKGYYSDYNLPKRRTTEIFSAAGITPLYFQIAETQKADRAARYLKKHLLFAGGVVSTTKETGQQWDYPNGWAPQQWMAYKGLKQYEHHTIADTIAHRWLRVTSRVFENTGKMMEKYNVVDQSLDAGGGEYPTQDGFGWTNGVTLKLAAELNQN